MIDVTCPSCSAPYQLAESRVPAKGLRMRCPKCGAVFRVMQDGTVTDATHSRPSPPKPASSNKGPIAAGPAATGPVVSGSAQQKPGPKKTVMGVAPPPPPVPPPAAPNAAPRKAPLKTAAKAAPPPPPAAVLSGGGVALADLDADLPAPATADLPAAADKPQVPRAFRPPSDLPGLPPAPPPPAPPGALRAVPGPPRPSPPRPGPPRAAPPVPSPAGLDAPEASLDEDDFSDLDLPAPKLDQTSPFAPGVLERRASLPAEPGKAPSNGLANGPANGSANGPSHGPAHGPASGAAAPLNTPFDEPQGGPADHAGTPFDELDLPAPAPAAAATPFDTFGDLDLPSPAKGPSNGNKPDGNRPTRNSGVDLPMPVGAAIAPGGGPAALPDDLDLPMPKGVVMDLPGRGAQAGTPSLGDFSDLDLPAPLAADLPAAAPTPFQDPFADLPAPQADLPAPLAADLPAPQAGLPAPRDPFGDLDLPTPAADLPMPAADLPMPAADLPMPMADLPELLRSDLPAAQAPGGGLLDLPEPQVGAPGSSDLPVPRAPGGGAMDLPVPSPVPPGPGQNSAFGDIELGGDEMEFDALPQERPSQADPYANALDPDFGLPGDLPLPPLDEEGTEELPAKRGVPISPKLVVVLALSMLFIGGGTALGATHYGYFGMYFFEQFLPAAGSDSEAQTVIAAAEKQAVSDTYHDARAALKQLASARSKTGLNRRLLARSLLHESLYQLRFGPDSHSAGRSARIIARLEQRGFEAPGVMLAQAAHALQQGDTSSASSFLAQANASDPMNPLLSGELALRQENAEQAATHFQKAVDAGLGARGHWGIARAAMDQGDLEAIQVAIDATLEASPGHVAAVTAKARLAWAQGDAEAALVHAKQATDLAAGDARVSPREEAEAWAFLGRLYEDQGERPLARRSYEHALEIDDFVVDALLGAGRLFLAEGRHRDALARFQAVVGSQTDLHRVGEDRSVDVQARLGAAKSMIALEEANEARALLQELQGSGAEDPEVVLYLGKVAEAVSDIADAERNYREAIRLAPQSFPPYLALAELFLAQDKPDPAQEILAQAEQTVEESAAMRSALGRFKLSQRDLAGAEQEYLRARELDPRDPATLFGLGVTLRRIGKLSEADAVFDALSQVDSGWTGLSLERGRVYEARGQGERAVAAYEQALAETPDDLDLELRLGAALVSVGRVDEGEERLHKVLEDDPNAIEAQHYMGRVFFERGDLSEAMTYFARAVALDGSRAEFHLYVAWAAFEQGKVGQALEEIEATIELDPTLPDAFWLRAQLRVRTGAARDAIKDLEEALKLRPDAPEFRAAMGDAYEQLRRLRDAIESYELALAQDPESGRWWYRLGQLQMDSGHRSEAATALARANRIGDAQGAPPPWLADAHRLEGDAYRLAGDRQAATRHYRRYLELAGEDALDRADVERRLDRWSSTGTATLRQ